MRRLNPKLIQLTRLLSDGAYHDGEALGLALGTTRSAIWKMIAKLKAYGVAVDACKGVGYALKEPLYLLDEKQLRKMGVPKQVGLSILEHVDSTNRYLLQLKHKNKIEVCIAEYQSAGRGRLGRAWHSPFGQNIYLSLLYPMQKEVSELGGLSLVTSLSVLQALKQMVPTLSFQAKWPNDVMLDGKKLGGILIDLQAESHGRCDVVIGIGLNINMVADTTACGQSWASLKAATHRDYDRNEIISVLIQQLINDLNDFGNHGFVPFMDQWHASDFLKDKMIQLNRGDQQLQGMMTGVNAHGHLLLVDCDEKLHALSAGEASLLRPRCDGD